LASKADVNAKDKDGATPLHYAVIHAVIHGNTDVVELLLANKADITAQSNNGRTPLSAAEGTARMLGKSATDLEALLRQHGRADTVKDVEQYKFNAINKFSSKDYDGAIADFDKAIDLNPDNAELYQMRGGPKLGKRDFAGAIADYNKAIELKPDCADAYKGRGLVMLAKRDFDDAIADFNKAIELKPNDAFTYNYRASAKRGKGDLDGANADRAKAIGLNTPSPEPVFSSSNTTSNTVTEYGELAKIKAVLVGNPDLISAQGKDGWTLLHYAVVGGHKDVASFLLANKADVNAKDNSGGTPLHLAAIDGNKDMAQLLLTNKADVNAKAIGGATPLYLSAENGHNDVTELLLANNADVNAMANNGWTPLHAALVKGHESVVQLLRQHGGHDIIVYGTTHSGVMYLSSRGTVSVELHSSATKEMLDSLNKRMVFSILGANVSIEEFRKSMLGKPVALYFLNFARSADGSEDIINEDMRAIKVSDEAALPFSSRDAFSRAQGDALIESWVQSQSVKDQ
jgi:ankyrin repeat protein